METIDCPWDQFDEGIRARLVDEVEDSGCVSLVRMIGIMMARPQCSIVKEEILPSLEYFHVRSGRNIGFYFAGYREAQPREAKKVIATVDGKNWMFDEWGFNDFRRELELRTKWTYNGTADLILTNAKAWKAERQPNSDQAEAEIDLSSAICVDLDHMKNIGAIQNVGSFFEQIFRYAEDQDGVDPTWGFSDAAGLKIAGSGLKDLLLSLIPKPLRKSVERAVGFAVRDISATEEEIRAKSPDGKSLAELIKMFGPPKLIENLPGGVKNYYFGEWRVRVHPGDKISTITSRYRIG